MMNNLDKFDSIFRYFFQEENYRFNNLKKNCEEIIHLISTDQEHHADYVARFLDLIEMIKTTHETGAIKLYFNLFNCIMRQLKYPEVGQALKDAYPTMVSPDAQFHTEELIQLIFDPTWDEGTGRFEDDPDTHWWTWED